MRSVNNQYKSFPTLTGSDLPYDFEIERSMKVYYRKDGALRRADSIYMKNTGHLFISIDDYKIKIKGMIKNRWIYEVKKIQEDINDIARI